MLSEVWKYSRMLRAIVQHLRSPLEPDPEGIIRKQMEDRADNFLAHATTVMSMPEHPYAVMFRLAGCSYADLESSVRRDGIETTLQKLLDEGVFLTHEEFRGKKEIVRSGRRIPALASMWNNPASKGGYVQSSSGTSGRPVTTFYSVAAARHGESFGMLFLREFSFYGGARVILAPILPGSGLLSAITVGRLLGGYDRWFATGGTSSKNLHYRIVTRLLVAEAKLLGLRVPYPTYLEQNDFLPAAEYAKKRLDAGDQVGLHGFVSVIARVAEAALSNGLELTGCRALTGGEALTDAKRQLIESAGIRVYSSYGTTDFGGIGMPCSQMSTGNCSHVLKHAIALVSRTQENAWTDMQVNSLYATSLAPLASRIFINAEIGDTGVIEKATCDCSFSKLGFDLQVRDIAAISKVTAQGVTIETTELVPLLEEALPARFGGHSGDYQLCETEAGSQTEIVLRIRPGVSAAPSNDILKHFLDEVKRVYGGSLSVVSWLHSEGIRAEVVPPVLAATGKFRAVRLLGASAQRALELKRPASETQKRARSAATGS
ncbi:MAG: hypothetical protein ABSB86_17060 [Bryobacteraceae bacterium]|jgi:hypothetical protein